MLQWAVGHRAAGRALRSRETGSDTLSIPCTSLAPGATSPQFLAAQSPGLVVSAYSMLGSLRRDFRILSRSDLSVLVAWNG